MAISSGIVTASALGAIQAFLLLSLACRKFYLVEMDSTFCKVLRHATGARKKLGNQNIGVDLTGGNVHDSEVAIKLLSKVALKGKKVLADKAFCSELIREYIFQEKAVASIADKSNSVSRL